MAGRTRKKTEAPATTVLLVRHATNDWVDSGRLAGRTPGVHLNRQGKAQAKALAQRLAKGMARRPQAIYSSPLERAQETADAIARPFQLDTQISEGIDEADFGDWTGQKLEKLAREPEWRLVQARPSSVGFPNGESIRQMQSRAVDAVERLVAKHVGETIILVTHADIVKAVVAHYLGLHLDLFQRLVISPASISTLSFTCMGGLVTTFNDTAHNPPDTEPDA